MSGLILAVNSSGVIFCVHDMIELKYIPSLVCQAHEGLSAAETSNLHLGKELRRLDAAMSGMAFTSSSWEPIMMA
jgi:hypothetical protein